jgi:rhodanese-related sulfurtransferase
MGYGHIRVLAGGIEGWSTAGYPLVQGLNVPSTAFGERVFRESQIPVVSARELDARLRAHTRVLVVDVRTSEEYVRGTIPGAWNVPCGELVFGIWDLLPNRDTPVVVHCAGRTRTFIAVQSLRRMGIQNPIYALENGTMGWQIAGLALEFEASRWPTMPSARSRALGEAAAAKVAREDAIPFVSTSELQRQWENRDRESVCIFDVRSPAEYGTGHIPGALPAPGGQMIMQADDRIAVRKSRLVFVCDTSTRSVMTATWMRQMGFSNAAVLGGGIQAWVQNSGAIERGEASVVPWGYTTARAMVTGVGPSALWAELHDDANTTTVLDVSESDAYCRAHVPGAMWLNRSRLEMRIRRLVPDHGQAIVVTCRNGLGSSLAAATLTRLGYEEVRVLEGGVHAWTLTGLPAETGHNRFMDDVDDIALEPYEKDLAAMEAYLQWEIGLDLEELNRERLQQVSPRAST